MTVRFNSMLRFATTRAQMYPHWPIEGESDGHPITGLDVDHLTVDVSVIGLGKVTIAASMNDKVHDSYGVEFDLEPSVARALGRQLIAAAQGPRVAPPTSGFEPNEEV